jgi:hypothetical protein
MALPQTVLERLVREPVNTPGWSSRLLLSALGLFVVALVVFAGLNYGYVPALKSQKDSLDAKSEQFSQDILPADQANIVAFYSQLTNIKTALDNHVHVSSFFAWLEQHTLGTIYYTKLSLTVANRHVLMNGAARSVADITDQIAFLQAQPEVERLVVNSISAVAASGVQAVNLWQFDVTLVMRKPLFAEAALGSLQPISGGTTAATGTATSTAP